MFVSPLGSLKTAISTVGGYVGTAAVKLGELNNGPLLDLWNSNLMTPVRGVIADLRSKILSVQQQINNVNQGVQTINTKIDELDGWLDNNVLVHIRNINEWAAGVQNWITNGITPWISGIQDRVASTENTIKGVPGLIEKRAREWAEWYSFGALLKWPVTGSQYGMGDAPDGPYNHHDQRKQLLAPYKITYQSSDGQWTNTLTGDKLPPACYVANSRNWDTEADWVNKQILANALKDVEVARNLPMLASLISGVNYALTTVQNVADVVDTSRSRIGSAESLLTTTKQRVDTTVAKLLDIDSTLAGLINNFKGLNDRENNFEANVLPQTKAALEGKINEAKQGATDKANAALQAANQNTAQAVATLQSQLDRSATDKANAALEAAKRDATSKVDAAAAALRNQFDGIATSKSDSALQMANQNIQAARQDLQAKIDQANQGATDKANAALQAANSNIQNVKQTIQDQVGIQFGNLDSRLTRAENLEADLKARVLRLEAQIEKVAPVLEKMPKISI